MATGKKSKLLEGEAEISKFLNGASRYKIQKYRQWGAPIEKRDGILYAHEDALDDFFRKFIKKEDSDV